MLAALIYNVVIFFAFLIYIPVIIWRMVFQGKYRSHFAQRFGYLGKDEAEKLTGRPVIWMHAVSVGETVAASPVAAELKRRYPFSTLVFTTVTDTGQAVARKVIKGADVFSYLPIDLPWSVRRFVKTVKPDILVLTESEFWPNVIRITKQGGGRVILANGRISDRSFKRYRYLGPIWRQTLSNIDRFCMQSDQDVDRILTLGADKTRVVNTGNTKFDQLPPASGAEKTSELKKEFGLTERDVVWVVGSTHPGEEEQILEAYQELRAEFPDLVLVLAPRHIERTDEIAKLSEARGMKTVRRTRIKERNSEEHRVILLDTIGELTTVYQIADIVFVGGSLITRGGHNILEPASVGKPVLFGPHMFNFVDITRLMLENNAAIQVQDSNSLARKLRELLKDEDERKALGERARSVVEKNRGASMRIVDVVGEYFE